MTTNALTIDMGDGVVYRQDHNGQWANLWLEMPVEDGFIKAHFIGELSDMCACVLPEHSCPWCREIHRLQRVEDEPLPF